MNNNNEGVLTISMDTSPPFISFNMDNEELVRIQADGTVIVNREGADIDAARRFYECLQIEGKTLHATIATLKTELAKEKKRMWDE